MPINYANEVFTRKPRQTERAREDQVKNSAGGYVFTLDQWKQLRRFLILGTEGGTYYIKQSELTQKNAQNVLKCIDSDIDRTLKEVIEVSDKGLAPKNDPAIFVLALCVVNRPKHGPRSYQISQEVIHKIVRTGTHFLTFVNYLNTLSSWGSGVMKIARKWYAGKSVDDLAYQFVKYQNRGSWTQRDALRMVHPTPTNTKQDLLYKWACDKSKYEDDIIGIEIIDAYMRAHRKDIDQKTLIKLIQDYKLTHEMLPTQFKKSPAVWSALSEHMPTTAMIRNLGVMSANGLLTADNLNLISKIEKKLVNVDLLQRARIHPMQVLFALKTYAQGQGFRGSLQWFPVPRVLDALNEAFYLSFKAVTPTGKRIMIACDVSYSMSSPIMNSNVSCCEATGALAMQIARTETNYAVYGFCHILQPLAVSPRHSLDEVARTMRNGNFGSTDCSLPMIHAHKTNTVYDAFIVLTDCETWSGPVHPFIALKKYREKVNSDAKLIVVGMAANDFTIADPSDAGMLDVVGMDTSVPNVMSDFIRGEV